MLAYSKAYKSCHEAELPGPRVEAAVDLTRTDYELFFAKLQAGFWDCAVCSEASGLHLPGEPTHSFNVCFLFWSEAGITDCCRYLLRCKDVELTGNWDALLHWYRTLNLPCSPEDMSENYSEQQIMIFPRRGLPRYI